MKAKAYWPSASTDEPQVLALAELLQDARLTRESFGLLGVAALARTEAGRRFDFRPTPAALADAAVTQQRDAVARQRTALPVGVNQDGTWYDPDTGQLAVEQDELTGEIRVKRVTSPDYRDRLMARIRQAHGGPVSAFAGDDDVTLDKDTAREDIGHTAVEVPHLARLSIQARRVGLPDTEDDMVQYRWSFDPPEIWRTQATCGQWVNSQAEALNQGRTWLQAAVRNHRG